MICGNSMNYLHLLLIRGYFYNEMRYINLCFTYLLTRPPIHELCFVQGKWTARKIPNPDYYEDLEPYKMTPIVR